MQYIIKAPVKSVVLCCIWLSAFCNTCMAQDEISDDDSPSPKRFSVGFSLGNGYPVGEYGSISASRLPMSRGTGPDTGRISGYARQGFHFSIDAACRIAGNFSVILAYSGNQESFDINALNAQYHAPYPPNTVFVYTTHQYFMWQFLAGPQYILPVSEACSLEFRALAGVAHLYSPELNYNGLQDTLTVTWPVGGGFGYSLGAGIKYTVPTEGALGVSFHLSAGYEGAIIRFPYYSTLTANTNGVNASQYNIAKFMNVGLIEISAGLSLDF